MARTRKICVLTGTRADYGLLRKLILTIEADEKSTLLLVVSGTHLVDDYGMTSTEILEDKIQASAHVPIWSGTDDPLSAAADTGRAIGGFAKTLSKLSPDVVVILGDRLEAFAMATAATVLGIPIAHIHGGELTEGAMDDSLRHAITKLSYLHLVTTNDHRQRVIQMGEDPTRVFNFGAPIVDAVSDIPFLSRLEISAQFDVRFGTRTALMTFHPAGMDILPADELISELLAALAGMDDLHVIITGTNSDIGSVEVRRQISDFVSEHVERVDYVESFGQLGYLSTMAAVDVVVGNSSSTVLEAPILKVPSILIGDRQAGRPLSASVLHPSPDKASIATAIRRTLEPTFAKSTEATMPTIFGAPGFAHRTFELLMQEDLPQPPRKRFWDLGQIPL